MAFDINRALGGQSSSGGSAPVSSYDEKKKKKPVSGFNVDRALQVGEYNKTPYGPPAPPPPAPTTTQKIANSAPIQFLARHENIPEAILNAASKPLEWAFGALTKAPQAAVKGVQAGTATIGDYISEAIDAVAGTNRIPQNNMSLKQRLTSNYNDAPTIGQGTGAIVGLAMGDTIQRHEQQLIQNHGQGSFLDKLIAASPDMVSHLVDEIVIPSILSARIGTEILKPGEVSTVKVTPEQAATALDSGKPMPPELRGMLRQAVSSNSNLEFDGSTPVGATRTIIGKYLLGGEEFKPGAKFTPAETPPTTFDSTATSPETGVVPRPSGLTPGQSAPAPDVPGTVVPAAISALNGARNPEAVNTPPIEAHTPIKYTNPDTGKVTSGEIVSDNPVEDTVIVKPDVSSPHTVILNRSELANRIVENTGSSVSNNPQVASIQSELNTLQSKLLTATPAQEPIIADRIKELTKQLEINNLPDGHNTKINNGPEVSSTTLASKAAKPIGDFQVTNHEPVAPGTPEFKLFDKVQTFIQKYAQRFGEGYQMRNTLGWYSPHTKNLFINGRNNVSVAAHETMHFVDDKLGTARKIITDGKTSVRTGLQKLYNKYYGAPSKSASVGTQVQEGLATLLQRYAEMPTTIESEFPDLVSEILKPGGQYHDPIFDQMIKDLRSLADEYHGLNALDKVGSRVQNSQSSYSKSQWLNLRSKIRTVLADDIYPVELLSKKVGKAMTPEDASLWLRTLRSWNGIAAQNVIGHKGVLSGRSGYYQIDPETGNLKKTLDHNWYDLVHELDSKGDVEDFGYWLVARATHFDYETLDRLDQAIAAIKQALTQELEPELRVQAQKDLQIANEERDHLAKTLEKDGILQKEATSAYEAAKDKFTQAGDMYDKLTQQDVEMMDKARLITPEQKAEFLAKEGYASRKREIFNEIVASEDGITDNNIKIGGTKIGALKRRSGSQRAILNPLYGGITNHLEITRKSLQQIVYNKINDELAPDLPELFQEVPLEPMVDSRGIVSFAKQEGNPDIIMARKPNGKRTALLVNREVRVVLDNILNPMNFGLAAQIGRSLSSNFTKGTTALWYQFALPNFIVDQMTAVSNTQNNYIPIYDALKKIGAKFKAGSPEAQYWDEYMIMAGERQTFAGWQDDSPEELIRKVNGEHNKLLKALDFVDDYVLGTLAKPSEYSEIFSRFTEYAKARESGKSTIVALEDAGRVTAPFHHIGSWGHPVIQMVLKQIPFANAGIQVGDQFTRTASTKKGAMRIALVMGLIIGASLYAWEKMQHASDKQKQQFKDIDPALLARYIYYPKPGGDGLIRIRVPEQLALPATWMNMALSSKMDGEDYQAWDYVTAGLQSVPNQLDPLLFGQFLNSWIPQGVKPAFQVLYGRKDFPNIQDIEPKSTQSLPVEKRTTGSTSALAKWLSEHGGKAFNLSPIKIDYLITGYLGRSSGYVTGKPNIANPISGLEQDYYFQSGRTLQNYYNVKTEVSQDATAYKKKLTDLNNDQLKALKESKSYVGRTDALIKAYNKVDAKANPGEAEKLRLEIMKSAQSAIDAYNRGKK